MITEVYQRLADRCREMLARARTDQAKEQLLLWVAEFESRAAEAEAEAEEFRNQEGGRAR